MARRTQDSFTHPVNVKITQEDWHGVNDIAMEEELPMAYVIRRAIRQYLKDKAQQKTQATAA